MPVWLQSWRGRKQAVPSMVAPTEVGAASGLGADDVDFVAVALPYIADPEEVGFGVECHAPWVAESVDPDFVGMSGSSM